MPPFNKKITDILSESTIINRPILNKAIENQRKTGVPIIEFLVKSNLVNENDLAQCLANQFGFPYVTLKDVEVSEDVVKLINKETAVKYIAIPVDRGADTLTVFMANPFDQEAVKDLEKITGLKIQAFVGVYSDIINNISRYYGDERPESAPKAMPFTEKKAAEKPAQQDSQAAMSAAPPPSPPSTPQPEASKKPLPFKERKPAVSPSPQTPAPAKREPFIKEKPLFTKAAVKAATVKAEKTPEEEAAILAQKEAAEKKKKETEENKKSLEELAKKLADLNTREKQLKNDILLTNSYLVTYVEQMGFLKKSIIALKK